MAIPLPESIINRLKQSPPKARALFLNETFSKNKSFFKHESPAVYQLLQSNRDKDLEIQLTESFLDIYDLDKQEYLHNKGQLDLQALDLKTLITQNCFDFIFDKLDSFNVKETLLSEMLDHLTEKGGGDITGKQVSLKQAGDSKLLYAPVGIFLGVSDGLKMLEYLCYFKHTHILIYEPDPIKFILSCYFVDYEKIKTQHKKYYISIGQATFPNALSDLFQHASFSPLCWTRVICLTESNHNNYLKDQVKAKINLTMKRMIPFEFSLQMRISQVQTMRRKSYLLSEKIKLGENYTIALIGSGPSLASDIDWLKKHKEKILIICCLSAVSFLVDNNVKPDIIISQDAHLNQDNLELMKTYLNDSPFLTTHTFSQSYYEYCSDIYVCGLLTFHNLVMFKHFLSYQGASSICMALSFALYCHPQQILLFGCDCSLDKDDKYHSKGTFHSYNHDDNKSGRYVLVKKNQNQNDFVKTTEELLSYKKSIEVILRQRQSMIKVYNLSGTGAYIEGSIPWSLERIKLNNKKHKSKGLAVLKNAFRAFKEGDNWYKFKNNSQELLDKYKKELIDKLMRQPKNWVELLEQLDFTAFEVYLKFRIGKNDGRLGIYMSLINSYLMIVYMYLLKFENFDDAILFYNQSIHYLSVKLSSLNWPNELDGF